MMAINTTSLLDDYPSGLIVHTGSVVVLDANLLKSNQLGFSLEKNSIQGEGPLIKSWSFGFWQLVGLVAGRFLALSRGGACLQTNPSEGNNPKIFLAFKKTGEPTKKGHESQVAYSIKMYFQRYHIWGFIFVFTGIWAQRTTKTTISTPPLHPSTFNLELPLNCPCSTAERCKKSAWVSVGKISRKKQNVAFSSTFLAKLHVGLFSPNKLPFNNNMSLS